MHIKQITISNFRSFKQQPEIHPFSSQTNCIIGRNGSGKSNLFDAVQFVLASPKFYSLRLEERQALLHEGSGTAAVNAFVEIVFDNSDNRFNLGSDNSGTNSDEVVLRRTIGYKKDEFFLQRKRTTKQEIISLLEGAGFSKSNPYFIVQQGKISNLCIMSDYERLSLLKEVAGTTIYDEKKLESKQKMIDNNNNISKINEILSFINIRLNELNTEKNELSIYTKLDRQRRCIEYTLYEKELKRSRETLDDIENTRSDDIEKLQQYHDLSKEIHSLIKDCESNGKIKSNILKRNKILLNQLENDYNNSIKNETTLNLECNELNEIIINKQEIIQTNSKEIERLNIEIQQAKIQLQPITENYDTLTVDIINMTNELNEAKKKIEGLYAKQGRNKQFNTKEERNAYLRDNIKELNNDLKEKHISLKENNTKISTTKERIQLFDDEIKQLSEIIEKKQASYQSLIKLIDEKKKIRIKLQDDKRDLWRQSETIHDQLVDTRDLYNKCKSDLQKVMPMATSMGIQALTSRIVQEEKLTMGIEYFGMVMDNFTLKDNKFQTAIDVAAQNTLFHVIVDNDNTASKLLKRLENEKLGRVTFLPLNKLRIDNVSSYPQSSDVISILHNCINYDPKVDRAMKHIFGKKLLARNVNVASDWSTKCKMDVITLDGDLCSRKGALTGGYVDNNKSRLKAHSALLESQESLTKVDNDYVSIKRNVHDIDQNITNIISELERYERKSNDMNRTIASEKRKYESKEKTNENNKKILMEIEKNVLPQINVDIKSIENHIQRLNDEMTTELDSELSDDDKKLLKQLKDVVVKELNDDIKSKKDELTEVGIAKQKLSSLLNDNLLKRKEELIQSNKIASSSSSNNNKNNTKNTGGQDDDDDDDEGEGATTIEKAKDELEQKQIELDVIRKKNEELALKVNETKSSNEKIRDEVIKIKKQLDELKNRDVDNNEKLEKSTEQSERLLNKRSMCISKRELYIRKIQELGSLPSTSEISQYNSLTISSLMKKLEGINKKLKKYSHVNKKAYDQYLNFSEQREGLLQRKDELDVGASKVQELIDSLDQQKDEAINRTFRGVSKHFKDIFKELVPNGSGELTMKTVLDEQEEKKNKNKKNKGGAKTTGEESDEESDEEDDDEEEEGTDDEMNDDDDDDGSPKKKKQKKTPKKKKKAKAKEDELDNPDVSMYRGIGIKVRFTPVGENYIMSQLSGGQKALVALALMFAIQRCDPAPFYLMDELDQALDSTYRAAVANLIERQSSSIDNPTQFIVSTFRPELVKISNRCYGISHQNKVSTIHHLSKKDSLHFIANLMNEEEGVGEVTSLATSKSRTSSSTNRKSISNYTNSKKRKAISDDASNDEGDDNDTKTDDDEETPQKSVASVDAGDDSPAADTTASTSSP